jgi:uncharacterized protein (TIGR00730 family)
MDSKKNSSFRSPHRSSQEEISLESLDSKEQTSSPSYQIAFTDQAFLLRHELRPVRLQLELLKPELIQQDQKIDSTIVVFGSARAQEPEKAEKALKVAQEALKKNPQDPELQRKLHIAERMHAKSVYYNEARRLGRLVSLACQPSPGQHCHFVIATGGGPGIMEAANRGAHDVKAKTVGLNILLPNEQGPNPYITPELSFQFHYFAIRKMHFLIRARAMVFFPGGFGTLDELFETLTLMQTKKIQRLPIILVGKTFWKKLLNFEFMVSEGIIDDEDLDLFQFAETAEEVWRLIGDFYNQ